MGYRFRLHVRRLPGSPDIVLPKWSTVIFVNGCFWHRHKRCKFAYTPKTRVEFWLKKFADNCARDTENVKALRRLGWRVARVWECQLRQPEILAERLQQLIERRR
jgi:DNA mismatch endonuclease (patch repair protein)